MPLSCSSASVPYILNHVEILFLCSFLSCVAIATDQMGKTDKLKALVTCGNQGQCDQKTSKLGLASAVFPVSLALILGFNSWSLQSVLPYLHRPRACLCIFWSTSSYFEVNTVLSFEMSEISIA